MNFNLLLYTSFVDKILTQLDYYDKQLFILINSKWTNSLFDQLFPIWRESSFWIPLYLFLLVFVLYHFKAKAWGWILFFILTVAISDQISSTLLKEWIGRVRPCRDEHMQPFVRLLVNYCPSSGSFTSSHATNHFALGMFIYLTLKPYFKKWGTLFFVWAGSIAFGQVYVGVHYPLDVLAGALLGCTIGKLFAGIFQRRVGLAELS